MEGVLKLRIRLAIIVFIILVSPTSHLEPLKIDKIVFSGGAALSDYQPRVIVPILTEAFKRNDIKFNAKYIPSARSLVMSNSGKTDGELHQVGNFHEVSNGLYPNLVKIDSELLSVWLAAFAIKKGVSINAWEDLRHYRVIYYRGGKNVQQYVEKYVPKEQVYVVSKDSIAFRMLLSGRADVIISESREGQIIINSSSEFSDVREIAKLNKTPIYSYINKKYEHLAPVIARTLDNMKRDGTFSQIINNLSD